MSRWLLALLVVGACTSPEVDYSELDDLDAVPSDGKGDGGADWLHVGAGVAYRQVNTGTGVLIAYGGYSAKLSYSIGWASELVDARLGAEGVGHIFAVRGPADPGYNAREIANTKLRAHLATFDDGSSPIYVVAHSSGSYVAHELLNQLRASSPAVLPRIAYANLDGGGGLSRAVISSLAAMSFVYARDTALSSGLSQNSGGMKAQAAAYAPDATAFEVKLANTGCRNGAGWCLHDVVITHKPHNPSTFDLGRDYVNFVDRSVTTEYLEPFVSAFGPQM